MKFWYDGYYDTMRGHARRRGIKPNTVEVRCHRYGNRPENYDRILHVGHVGRKLYRIDGILGTVSEHARRKGLDVNTIQTRVKRGMRLEDALIKPFRAKPGTAKRVRVAYAEGVIPKGSRFEWGGHVDTLAGHAARLGLTPSAVSSRAKFYGRRYDKLDLLLHPGTFKVKHPPVWYRGKYATPREHCRRLGLRVRAVLARIKHRGFSPQESLDVAYHGEHLLGRGLVFNGECRSLTGWARKVGLSRTALRGRLSKGATLRQALTPGRWKKPDIVRDARSVPTRSRRGRELAALGIIL